MKILALDTTLGACSAALLDTAADKVLAREFAAMQRGHAEALMPMVARVMAASGLSFPDLDRIAVTLGPGSFTGVRVGVAAARALALACSRPAIGIGTLEAHAASLLAAGGTMAGGDLAGGAFAIALDARRGEVYMQAFDAAGGPLDAPQALSPELAAQALAGKVASLHGSGAALIAAAAGQAGFAVLDLPPGPDPVAIARLAAARPLPDGAPVPLYLRAPDAKPQPGALARREGAGAAGPVAAA